MGFKKSIVILLCAIFLGGGCGNTQIANDPNPVVIPHAQIPTACLLNIPLQNKTWEVSFIGWINSDWALVRRTGIGEGGGAPNPDLFCYCLSTDRAIQIDLSEVDAYPRLGAVAAENYLILAGDAVYSESGDGTYRIEKVWVYDMSKGGLPRAYQVADWPSGGRPPQGSLVVSDLEMQHEYWIDAKTGVLEGIYYWPCRSCAYDVAVSPDGARIAYCNEDGLFVAPRDMSESFLLVASAPTSGNDLAETWKARCPVWMNNSELTYRCYSYSGRMMGSARVNVDTGVGSCPDIFAGRYVLPFEEEKWLVTATLYDSEAYLGFYDVSTDELTAVKDIDYLASHSGLFFAPDKHEALMVGPYDSSDPNSDVARVSFLQFREDEQLIRQQSIVGYYFMPVFSPDGSWVIFGSNYGESPYMLYKVPFTDMIQ